RWASGGDVDHCDRSSFCFSSRRRHTSCLSDWSSDVCSSDLATAAALTSPWPTTCAASPGRCGRMMLITATARRHARAVDQILLRSEERRVGKEGRSSGAAEQSNKQYVPSCFGAGQCKMVNVA